MAESNAGISIENYRQRDIKLGGLAVNLLGLAALLVLAALFGSVFYMAWGTFGIELGIPPVLPGARAIAHMAYYAVIGAAIALALVLANDVITGIYWSKHTEVKLKVTVRGPFLRFLYCSKPLRIKPYITGMALPAVIMGAIPAITGIIFGNILVVAMGVLFIANGTAVFMVMYLLRKEGKNSWVKDMDTAAGFTLYSPKG